MIPYEVNEDLRKDLNKSTNVIVNTINLSVNIILYFMFLLSSVILLFVKVSPDRLWVMYVIGVGYFIAIFVAVIGIITFHRRLMRCK